MQSITEVLTDFVFEYPFEKIPDDVIKNTKECIIDTLSGTLTATDYSDVQGIIDSLTKYDTDQTSSMIWGTDQYCSLQNALILNGTMGHTTEMDDVHKLAKTHVGTIAIPAALTLGTYLGSSGKEVLRAIALSYEIALRIGIGIGAVSHRLQGWHATGTCGIFASAAAAAILMKLSKNEFVSALGLAGTQASGLWAFTADGASCKKFHAGKAAHGGVLASILASGGMTGPAFILEAEDGGLYKAASNEYNYKAVVQELGETWEIMKIDRKPFSCCRSMHPAIDAVMQIQNEILLLPENIKHIEVETYEVGYKQCGTIVIPQNVSEAQFSIPYGVAAALCDKAAGLAQFSRERIKDKKLLELAKKVHVYASERFSAEYPRNWGCEVTVTTKDNKEYKKYIVNAKGDHSVPLSINDLREKFISLSGHKYKINEIQNIIDTVFHLETAAPELLVKQFYRQ